MKPSRWLGSKVVGLTVDGSDHAQAILWSRSPALPHLALSWAVGVPASLSDFGSSYPLFAIRHTRSLVPIS